MQPPYIVYGLRLHPNAEKCCWNWAMARVCRHMTQRLRVVAADRPVAERFSDDPGDPVCFSQRGNGFFDLRGKVVFHFSLQETGSP